jgi:type IV pilus assembly protein PilW
MNARRFAARADRAPGTSLDAGFGLIELMISMLLGLLVVAGVCGVFLANKQAYSATSALGEVQDASRIGFEMLARDIRAAGLTGCGNQKRVANVLNSSTINWWSDWSNAVHGYDGNQTDPAVTVGGGSGDRVSGTASVHLLSAGNISATVQKDTEPGASIHLNEPTSDLQDGDVVIICDYDHAAIAQVDYNPASSTVVHDTGNNLSPGNCSKGLGYPTDCSSSNGNVYTYPPNSQIAKLTADDWYIGNNPLGGRSLYRLTLLNSANLGGGSGGGGNGGGNGHGGGGGGSGVSAQAQEMLRNVTDMQIAFRQSPNQSFIAAASVTDWSVVDAAQISLAVKSTDQRVGTGAQPISRKFVAVVTVRNRVQ